MNKLTKLALSIAFVFGLAACDDNQKEQRSTTEQKVNEVTNNTSSFEFPKVSDALLKPIIISDKKSDTGADDFNLLVEWSDKNSPSVQAQLKELQTGVMSPVSTEYAKKHGKINDMLQERLDEIIAFHKQTLEELAQVRTKVKDPEVLELIDRTTLLETEWFNLMAKMVTESPKFLYLKDNSPEAEKFSKESQEPFEKMQQARTILENALAEFVKKYQQ